MLKHIKINTFCVISTAFRRQFINFPKYLSSQSGTESTENGINNSNIPIIDFDGPIHLPLPFYPPKINESLHQQKQRLIYQSRKRGMLENDLLLSTFASKYLKSMNAEQTEEYDKLINGPTNDWDIFYWAIGNKPTPAEYDTPVMKMLKDHVKNPDKEKRLRQPNLEI